MSKKNILKLKIKSLVCRCIVAVCVLAPILSCESLLFDNTRAYWGVLGVSLVVGYVAFNGFVHAERKLFRMRKQAAQIKSEENGQDELAA